MSDVVTRGLLINGQEVVAGDGGLVADMSPWSGQPYAYVAAATVSDVTAAVDAAAAAFPEWSAMGVFARRQIFLRAADLMASREEQAIETMAGEVGAARPWAAFNVKLCAEILREAAAAITQPSGQILATDILVRTRSRNACHSVSSPRSRPGTLHSFLGCGRSLFRWLWATRSS